MTTQQVNAYVRQLATEGFGWEDVEAKLRAKGIATSDRQHRAFVLALHRITPMRKIAP